MIPTSDPKPHEDPEPSAFILCPSTMVSTKDHVQAPVLVGIMCRIIRGFIYHYCIAAIHSPQPDPVRVSGPLVGSLDIFDPPNHPL